MKKLHKHSICYFHHCSYIGLLCISQICMNAIILHNDNARIVSLINILIIIIVQLQNWCSDSLIGRHWLLSCGPNSHLFKLNVIVFQVEQEAFTRELVAIVHQGSSNHNLIDVYIIVIWPELYLLLNRPKIQRKQYIHFLWQGLLTKRIHWNTPIGLSSSSGCLWIILNVFLLELMYWCCWSHRDGWMVR